MHLARTSVNICPLRATYRISMIICTIIEFMITLISLALSSGPSVVFAGRPPSAQQVLSAARKEEYPIRDNADCPGQFDELLLY